MSHHGLSKGFVEVCSCLVLFCFVLFCLVLSDVTTGSVCPVENCQSLTVLFRWNWWYGTNKAFSTYYVRRLNPVDLLDVILNVVLLWCTCRSCHISILSDANMIPTNVLQISLTSVMTYACACACESDILISNVPSFVSTPSTSKFMPSISNCSLLSICN